jgi:serine/threonine protein kinase
MVTLKDLKDAIPRMSEDTCKRFMKEIFTLVKVVHDGGFIHHDLKLANILIMHDGTLRLCDGGMSQTIKNQRNQKANFNGKKCYYVAPEIREGWKLRKPTAVDIYSVGVALTHMRGVVSLFCGLSYPIIEKCNLQALREGMAGAVQEAFPLGRYPEAHQFLHSVSIAVHSDPGTDEAVVDV